MIKNYFKTAWRNLMKNKFYSAINIAGLAIGLATGIMILFWTQDEFSFDGFHKHADQIYKVNSHFGTGKDAQVWEDSPAPLAVMCKQSIPEVTDVVRMSPRWEKLLLRYEDKKFVEIGSGYVDPSFFTLFDFSLIKGNPSKPFADDNSVVLTSSVAEKYFGDKDPIGKVLLHDKESYVVTGVIKDFPANSGLSYTMMFPMSLWGKKFTAWGGNGQWKTIDEDLGNYQYFTYLLLQKNTSAETVGKKLTKIFRDKKGVDARDDFFKLQPLKTVHLVAADGNKNALQTVRIFLLVAVLILSIACINYVNLSTARSMLRAKEVSIRKMIGAGRVQLFIQFIAESVLMFLFAAILALAIIKLLLPLYNEISGKQLVFNLSDRGMWAVIGYAILATMALSGIYPAILLSGFRPLQVLKGKIAAGLGNANSRKILVVTQFTFSIGLIIATLVIGSQLSYIKSKHLGFDKEHVFSFGLTGEMNKHYDAIKSELIKQPGVLGLASSNNSIVGVSSSTGDTDWEGKENDREFMVHPIAIDENLLPLLKIQLVAGSNFTGSKVDSSYFILNETAVKQAGIEDPVGKRFSLWETKGTIKGVVKDFNYASLKYAVEPVVFYYSPPYWRMYIKTTGKDAALAIQAAQKVWKQYASEFPFEYSFLDQDFDHMYKSEQRTGSLFNVFAAIAVIISCLGLFGLSTYTAEVKTKEIGIRKVLGASVESITRLLAKEFVILVLIAILIALPIAGIAMYKWLQNYVYRIDLGWKIFLGTGALSVLIAMLTVSFQSIRAAVANPVKSLRSE